jgi:hypothetical protein
MKIIQLNGKRWAENVVRMGEKKNTYKAFVGKSGRKRSLERPRRRC